MVLGAPDMLPVGEENDVSGGSHGSKSVGGNFYNYVLAGLSNRLEPHC